MFGYANPFTFKNIKGRTKNSKTTANMGKKKKEKRLVPHTWINEWAG